MKRLASILAFSLSVHAATFDEIASKAAEAPEANDVARATGLYKQAVAIDPSWAEGWWFLGTLAYDADRYEEGRTAFARFTKLQNAAAPGWGFLGLCEFETGHFDDALAHIGRGLSLGGLPPDTGKVLRFHQALALTRLGLFDQALRDYLPLVRQGSKDPALAVALGLTALRRPMLPNDVESSRRDLFLAAGKTAYLWISGDISGAEAGLQALLKGFPDEPGVNYFAGTFLLDARPTEAGAAFRRELAVNPASPDARAMIAFTLIRSGDDAAALPLARQAASDGPSTAMARYAYGLLLSRSGDRAGIAHLEAAVKLDPSNLEYHLALAGAYSKFGRLDAARRERRASIEMARATDPRAEK